MKPEGILSEAPATPEARTALRITDEIDRKLAQASGILAIVGISGHTNEVIPDDAVINATWAARDLLKQAGDLVGELRKKAAPAAEEVAS